MNILQNYNGIMDNYIVTALEPQKNNKKRYNLYLDGQFKCALALDSIAIFRIKVGQTLSEEELQNILDTTETQIAFDKCLNLLSKSMKTKQQIKEYLQQKGFGVRAVENVLQKLENYGYVDDVNYAKVFVAQNKKTKGVYRIKQELFLKGIPKQIIEEALLDLDTDETLESAIVVAKKFLKDKPIDQKELQRLNRHLLSRGFDFETVSRVISVLKNDFADCRIEGDFD